ncbi:MAG TPA: hypothetical protein VI454_13610 [Verrucomicrobiae bacterium]
MHVLASKSVWVFAVALIAGCFFLWQHDSMKQLRSENDSLRRELADTRATVAEVKTLRRENATLSTRAIDPHDLARLRADSTELQRLRAERAEGQASRATSSPAPSPASPVAANPRGATASSTATINGVAAAGQTSAPSAGGSQGSATVSILPGDAVPFTATISTVPGGSQAGPNPNTFPPLGSEALNSASATEPLTAPFAPSANANLDAGQTLVTGGWDLGDGQRGYVLVTPTIDAGAADGGHQTTFDLKIVQVPESQFPQSGLEKWLTANGATDQNAVLDTVATYQLITALNAVPGVDLLSAPKITTTNGGQPSIQFGGSKAVSVSLSPTVGPDGRTLTVQTESHIVRAAVKP